MRNLGEPVATGNGGANSTSYSRYRDNGEPAPVVRDVYAMMEWLVDESDLLPSAASDCYVVVCRADPVEGVCPELLAEKVAGRFAHALRSYDAIFLHDEDHILLGLPQIECGDVVDMMSRLRCGVAENPVRSPDGEIVNITVSMGGAMMNVYTNIKDTVGFAARAMNLCRNSGGDRVCMWRPES